jgi:hypothetical protein
MVLLLGMSDAISVRRRARRLPPGERALWTPVVSHTHMLQGELAPPDNAENLIAWAADRGIGALGVGSPYTPRSAALYRQYDNEGRRAYYHSSFDPQSVKAPEEARRLIETLNRLSGGKTFFYLDNETPKARYGHLWWVGWHHDFPAWHDYDQPFDRWMCNEQEPGDDGDEPMPYERRPYSDVLARQRARGALGIWAHPTSWWRTKRGAFVTNIASELPAHLAMDGFADGMVVMGYDAYRPAYLALWHALLDAGYRLPGVAEMDIGLSTKKLWDREPRMQTWVRSGRGSASLAAIRRGLRRGRAFVSSGPFIDLAIDGAPAGAVVETHPGSVHKARIRVDSLHSDGRLDRIELIGAGGRCLWSADDVESGIFHLTLPGRTSRGWLIARAFGKGSHPGRNGDRDIFSFAATNPVYLHPPGGGFPEPMQTDLRLTVSAASPFRGGTVLLETLRGGLLEKWTAHSGVLACTAPVASRLVARAPTGETLRLPLINANRDVMDLQRYLYRGRFLRDWPDAEPGDVPPEAFRLHEFRDALRRTDIAL